MSYLQEVAQETQGSSRHFSMLSALLVAGEISVARSGWSAIELQGGSDLAMAALCFCAAQSEVDDFEPGANWASSDYGQGWERERDALLRLCRLRALRRSTGDAIAAAPTVYHGEAALELLLATEAYLLRCKGGVVDGFHEVARTPLIPEAFRELQGLRVAFAEAMTRPSNDAAAGAVTRRVISRYKALGYSFMAGRALLTVAQRTREQSGNTADAVRLATEARTLLEGCAGPRERAAIALFGLARTEWSTPAFVQMANAVRDIARHSLSMALQAARSGSQDSVAGLAAAVSMSTSFRAGLAASSALRSATTGGASPSSPAPASPIVYGDRKDSPASTKSTARYSFDDLLGESPAIVQARAIAARVADTDATILIVAPTGCGKEVLAQAIHSVSSRASNPFVSINCGAIPRELIEAELFGYERGAFTGAKNEGAAGKFEAAADGTILLDEIGDMPLDVQVKLLRVLQERTFVRVGGSNERKVRARVIATTHRPLDRLVSEGRFRSDLYFRLRVVPIELPALVERPDDIPLLAEHALRVATQRHGKRLEAIDATVMAQLTRYSWPGNVRELMHLMEGEVTMAEPDETVLRRLVTFKPLPAVERTSQTPAPQGVQHASSSPPRTAAVDPRTYEDMERELLRRAWREHFGNISRMARALGLSRNTVYKKLERFNLSRESFVLLSAQDMPAEPDAPPSDDA